MRSLWSFALLLLTGCSSTVPTIPLQVQPAEYEIYRAWMDQKTRSNPHHLPFSVRDLTADGSWQQLTFEKRCLPKTESALVRSLARDPLLRARVERLMTIPAAGPITALTWVLEVDDVTRFGTVKQAIIYCGLCGAERSSAETVKRMPISKQRNKHLQSVLGEAAKLGPRLTPDLALVYDLQRQKGHANRATLAVARKLVAYLLAVDRSGKEFVVAAQSRAAA